MVRQQDLSDRGIQVMPLEDLTRRFAVLQGKAIYWNRLSNGNVTELRFGSPRKQHRWR